MATSNGGSLAVLAGSEAGNGSSSAAGLDGTDTAAEARTGGRTEDDIADHSDDEHGGDVGSDDSDSMDFDDDDDDDGSDLMSNTTLGDDITAQLAAAGNYIRSFSTMFHCSHLISFSRLNSRPCWNGGSRGNQLVEKEEAPTLFRDESLHSPKATDETTPKTPPDD